MEWVLTVGHKKKVAASSGRTPSRRRRAASPATARSRRRASAASSASSTSARGADHAQAVLGARERHVEPAARAEADLLVADDAQHDGIRLAALEGVDRVHAGGTAGDERLGLALVRRDDGHVLKQTARSAWRRCTRPSARLTKLVDASSHTPSTATSTVGARRRRRRRHLAQPVGVVMMVGVARDLRVHAALPVGASGSRRRPAVP